MIDSGFLGLEFNLLISLNRMGTASVAVVTVVFSINRVVGDTSFSAAKTLCFAS